MIYRQFDEFRIKRISDAELTIITNLTNLLPQKIIH